jgi:subtilisin family serine protease
MQLKRRSILGLAPIATAAIALVPAPSRAAAPPPAPQASPYADVFFSEGRWQPIAIDVDRTVRDADGGELGLPVRFGATRNVRAALGAREAVLTRRIVFALDDAARLADASALPGVRAVWRAPFGRGVHFATFDTPQGALAGANALVETPGVRYAHPDFILPVEARQRDAGGAGEPLFPAQWNMATIGVETAWRSTDGDPREVVAMIDLGFEESHPDLKDAWLINPGEIPGNGKDDDQNGKVDDVTGWNFATGGANLIYGADNSHGTCTSGIVGARVNGQGTSGICPSCRLLPLVIDDVVSNEAAAFHYAIERGATVISNSWGYSLDAPRTDVLVEAIKTAAETGRGGLGVPIVFAMGNFGADDCAGSDPDISALPTVVAVSSVDKTDTKVGASGYGACLAVVAPSSESQANGIVTTDRVGTNGFNTGANASDLPDLSYTNTFYGTSAAAPQVAGSFALLLARDPSLTREAVIDLLAKNAAKVSPGAAAYDANGHSAQYGYGRLDVGRAMTALEAILAPR